jgi:hypothetical protein
MPCTVVVAVDVGKNEFAFSVTDSSRAALVKPRTGCPMTGPSLTQVVADLGLILPSGARVKVGIEAAGRYHRALLAATSWPCEWELLELSPADVTEQRRVLGSGRLSRRIAFALTRDQTSYDPSRWTRRASTLDVLGSADVAYGLPPPAARTAGVTGSPPSTAHPSGGGVSGTGVSSSSSPVALISSQRAGGIGRAKRAISSRTS